MQVQKEKKKPPKPPMDFSAPTPEMIEDAKKYGLDLTDPSVFFKKNSISEHGQQTRKRNHNVRDFTFSQTERMAEIQNNEVHRKSMRHFESNENNLKHLTKCSFSVSRAVQEENYCSRSRKLPKNETSVPKFASIGPRELTFPSSGIGGS